MTTPLAEKLPSITIIIPVLHSLDELRHCLESIDDLDYPKDRFQVAVIDCHAVTGLESFSRVVLPTIHCNVDLISLPETAKNDAPAWLIESRTNEARNAALSKMPAEIYAFTEDDCTFPRTWLRRIANVISDKVGAIGGPEILPKDLSWFAQSLDTVLNSRIGAGGLRRGGPHNKDTYYPRKQNMAYSNQVIEAIEEFPEDLPISGDLFIATKTRDLGLKILYLDDNAVWHRRVNTLVGFFRLSMYSAACNVQLLKQHRHLFSSAYGYVILAGIFLAVMLIFSWFNDVAATIVTTLFLGYALTVTALASSAAIHARDVRLMFGVIALTVAHHLSILIGASWGSIRQMEWSKIDHSATY